jgi:putative ABC transport system permease protein
VLLVVQFTFSMIFILTVIVLYNQLNLFLHSDYGFNTDNKILIQKGSGNVETLKNELLKESSVSIVSAISHIPSAGIIYAGGYKKSLNDKDWIDLYYYSVDEDYLKSMEIPLIAGSFFSAEAGESNKNFIVFNEAAVKAFHFSSPIDAVGHVVIDQRDSTEKKIIGVVRDYNHEMASQKLNPLALVYNADEYRMLQISYTGDFTKASQSVERAWSSVYPGVKIDLRDFKQQMSEIYEILFGTLVKVLGFITVLAVVISCLGFLGMATYTIETRKKEIAVRKVLGSSNRSLVFNLSKGYLNILGVAVVLAVPASYFINTLWLEQFAFHVSIDWITISLGVIILFFFGLLTIGSQTLQAIFINPVENLKNE